MLTDAMLSEAAAEAERFLLTIVPEDGEPHTFSKRFEWKMRKLIRRTNHPIRYQVMRTAAAVVLAIATLFGAVMAISPEARAAVIGWVKSAFHEFFEYSLEKPPTNDNIGNSANTGATNNSTTPNEDKNINDDSQDNEHVRYEYQLSVIPEGYRELNMVERLDGRTYLYINNSMQMLQFSYTYGAENSSMFAKAEEYEQHSVIVNERPADVYIAIKDSETSGIVWQDVSNNILFQISAIYSKDELIAIAETVEKIKP